MFSEPERRPDSAVFFVCYSVSMEIDPPSHNYLGFFLEIGVRVVSEYMACVSSPSRKMQGQY